MEGIFKYNFAHTDNAVCNVYVPKICGAIPTPKERKKREGVQIGTTEGRGADISLE